MTDPLLVGVPGTETQPLLTPMPSGLPCLARLFGGYCPCPLHWGQPCAGPDEPEGHQHDAECPHG